MRAQVRREELIRGAAPFGPIAGPITTLTSLANFKARLSSPRSASPARPRPDQAPAPKQPDQASAQEPQQQSSLEPAGDAQPRPQPDQATPQETQQQEQSSLKPAASAGQGQAADHAVPAEGPPAATGAHCTDSKPGGDSSAAGMLGGSARSTAVPAVSSSSDAPAAAGSPSAHGEPGDSGAASCTAQPRVHSNGDCASKSCIGCAISAAAADTALGAAASAAQPLEERGEPGVSIASAGADGGEEAGPADLWHCAADVALAHNALHAFLAQSGLCEHMRLVPTTSGAAHREACVGSADDVHGDTPRAHAGVDEKVSLSDGRLLRLVLLPPR